MIPRIILASLLTIALLSPPVSADVAIPAVPDPCAEVECPDINCDGSCIPPIPDPTPCWETGECEHPVDELEWFLQQIYDQYGRAVLCSVLEREPSYLGYCDAYGNPRIQPDTQRILGDANAAVNSGVTLAVNLANYAVGLVPTQEEVEQIIDENAPDTDGDDIPDVAEQAVCGPAIVRNNLDVAGYVYCVSAADLYVEPTGTFTDEVNATRDAAVAFAESLVAWALSEVENLVSQVDADRDNVPDEAEPWICQVENANFPEDGTCDSTLRDYTPPA